MESFKYASVIVDTAVAKPLDYLIPQSLIGMIGPGSRVKVPVRGKIVHATVLSLKERSEVSQLSFIQETVSSATILPDDLLRMGLWISSYYCTPFFKVIKQLLPPSVRKDMAEKKQLFLRSRLSRPQLAQICVQKQGGQRKAIEVLLEHPQGILLSELLEKASISKSPVTSLEKEGIISTCLIAIDRTPLTDHDFFPTKAKILNEEQQNALDSILSSIQANKFQTHLLFGITGSGKTEVYLQAIEATLSQGKSALFLVPEIALTSQTMQALRSRFQEKVAILHHRLSPGERRDSWYKIREGSISLVVGPRSAVFSPLKNLGLVIVDEEHDSAYKQQDDAPCYHGRDVAVVRGKICGATVVLGSATPSLESYHNALRGKYILNALSKRADHASLPTVHIVDMKPEFKRARGLTLFSEKLLQGIEKRLHSGEQTLLFLNRRGFYSSSACAACGEKVGCPSCSMTLTFHKGENSLSCHLCGYETIPLRECPQCHASGSFKFQGAGTEHVQRALHAIFPEIRTLRLDADTTRHKGSHDKLFKQFRAGKADVLIGTQMIAKGLHFPSVTLVGVLNPDLSLHIPDFRSTEHVFQLVTQVAGRSGRSQLKGEVILQTTLPTHSLYQHAAQLDYLSFYEEESKVRKQFYYPPFCHLVKLLFVGPDPEKTRQYGEKMRQELIQKLPPSFEFNPMIACGHAKIKNHYRFQCLIKAESTKSLTDLLKIYSPPASIRVLIDIDPISTYF